MRCDEQVEQKRSHQGGNAEYPHLVVQRSCQHQRPHANPPPADRADDQSAKTGGGEGGEPSRARDHSGAASNGGQRGDSKERRGGKQSMYGGYLSQ